MELLKKLQGLGIPLRCWVYGVVAIVVIVMINVFHGPPAGIEAVIGAFILYSLGYLICSYFEGPAKPEYVFHPDKSADAYPNTERSAGGHQSALTDPWDQDDNFVVSEKTAKVFERLVELEEREIRGLEEELEELKQMEAALTKASKDSPHERRS